MRQLPHLAEKRIPRRYNKYLILLAILVVFILTCYCYHNNLHAYRHAGKAPVNAPEAGPPAGKLSELTSPPAVEPPLDVKPPPAVEQPLDAKPPSAVETEPDVKSPPTVEPTPDVKKPSAVKPQPDVKPPVKEEPPARDEPSTTQSTGKIRQLANGDDLLVLITKETSLGKYKPHDLVTLPAEMCLNGAKYQLRREAYQQLRAMWEETNAAGAEFFVTSAYRSYAAQKRIFNNYAAKHGEKKANTFSARPGQSEHQLGTTVDLCIPGYVLANAFGNTTSGQWLADNAYRYGFVMSYPKGTTDITGYIYEPWHFRYIGVDNAAAWKQSGLVLCQYLAQQPQYWK